MHRPTRVPLVALFLILIAGLASACQHAEPPRDVEPEIAAPASSEPFPLEVVTVSRLNVRSGPGAEHPIVGRLANGEQVRVLEEAEGWKRVRPDAGGPEGWVAGEFLRNPPTP
jgi:uncharacterized protein YgiM (DUF1202 family)